MGRVATDHPPGSTTTFSVCGLPGQPEHRLLPHRPGIRRSNPCRAHPAEPPSWLPRCSPSFLPSLSRGGAPHISSAPTQGHPSPGRSAPPRSASESVRADTLRAHPENAAAPAQHPSTERRYRPNVTSGCPKRSEGGCPVGTRTITAFPNGTTRKPPS